MQKYLKSEEHGRPRTYSVSKITEFVEMAIFFDDEVAFRGQTVDRWPLVPSVGRNIDQCRLLSRETQIVDEFKRESIPFIDVVPQNDWQWLALAQHNRLPTRLLDWTRNPLAALWFAVKDPAIDKQPGVVWAFHYSLSEAMHHTRDRESPFFIDKTYVYFPEHVSPFIQAQSGVFTVHHREKEQSGIFSPLEHAIRDPEFALTKIEIPPEAFANIRYELFRIGVSAASLFPGLLGIVDRIRYDNVNCKDEEMPKQAD